MLQRSSERRAIAIGAVAAVVATVLGVGAVGAVGFCSTAAALPLRAQADDGPVLVLWEPGSGVESEAAPEAHGDRAVAIAFASLPEAVVARGVDALDELAVRSAARHNPLVEDLFDGEPGDRLRAWATAHAPVLSAADALAEQPFASSDGKLVVTIAERCPADPGARCAPLFGESRDPAFARARFLAWPLTAAIVLRADTEPCARELVLALSARAASNESRVALVLGEADATRADTALEGDARRLAGRAVALPRSPANARLAALARPRPAARLFPSLGLTSRDVLVVPRLGALAEHDAFVAEARDAAVSSCNSTMFLRGSAQ